MGAPRRTVAAMGGVLSAPRRRRVVRLPTWLLAVAAANALVQPVTPTPRARHRCVWMPTLEVGGRRRRVGARGSGRSRAANAPSAISATPRRGPPHLPLIASERYKRWELDALVAALAALATGVGGEWPPSGSALPTSDGAAASAAC